MNLTIQTSSSLRSRLSQKNIPNISISKLSKESNSQSSSNDIQPDQQKNQQSSQGGCSVFVEQDTRSQKSFNSNLSVKSSLTSQDEKISPASRIIEKNIIKGYVPSIGSSESEQRVNQFLNERKIYAIDIKGYLDDFQSKININNLAPSAQLRPKPSILLQLPNKQNSIAVRRKNNSEKNIGLNIQNLQLNTLKPTQQKSTFAEISVQQKILKQQQNLNDELKSESECTSSIMNAQNPKNETTNDDDPIILVIPDQIQPRKRPPPRNKNTVKDVLIFKNLIDDDSNDGEVVQEEKNDQKVSYFANIYQQDIHRIEETAVELEYTPQSITASRKQFQLIQKTLVLSSKQVEAISEKVQEEKSEEQYDFTSQIDIPLDSNSVQVMENPGASASSIERGPGFYTKLGRGDVKHVIDAQIIDQIELS